jgi:hypothetical protein
MIRYQTLSQLHGNVNIGSPSAASWLQYFSNSRLYNSKDISPLEIVQFERYFSTGDRTILKIFLHSRSYNSKDNSPLEIVQFKRYFSTGDRTIRKIFLHSRSYNSKDISPLKIVRFERYFSTWEIVKFERYLTIENGEISYTGTRRRNIVHWYQKKKYCTLVPEGESVSPMTNMLKIF